MAHIVLLGDSIFDNASYVASGPAVIDHLRRQVPSGWQATLRAVDGDVTTSVAHQLSGIPFDATHLIVSIGGNDALMQSNILRMPASSVAEVMLSLSQVTAEFEQNYREMLHGVLQRGLPTAVCTIYNPRYNDPMQQQIATAALCLFNDCIIRAATTAGIPVIDLRLIFTDYEDYANDIEPSVAGGDKIVKNIIRLVQEHDFSRGRCAIYAE